MKLGIILLLRPLFVEPFSCCFVYILIRAVKNMIFLVYNRFSSRAVAFAGADGEFPVTRAATELMHDLRRKKSTTISPALWLLSFLCSY